MMIVNNYRLCCANGGWRWHPLRVGLLVMGVLVTSGSAIAQSKTPEEQAKDIQAQVTLLSAQTSALTAQQQLLTAQMTLQVLQQTSQAAIDKGTIDKLKDLLVSQSAFDKAKGAAPFAELQGIKEGLTGLAVPGKEGLISISKGTEGSLLLRVKKEMLESLDSVARDIVSTLPQGHGKFILATNSDIEAAYKSEIYLEQLLGQTANLSLALKNAQLRTGEIQTESLASGIAAVQSVPFLLNVLSDAGKFFRVDRTISIFDAGEEAKRILESFVEAHANKLNNPSRIVRIDDLSPEVITHAKKLLKEINTLKVLHDQATDHAGKVQRALDEAAKLPPGQAKPKLPSPEVMVTLKGEISSTKAMLDAINPGSHPDNFWSQVAGQVKNERSKGHGRIHLAANAQTVQVLEKRVWRSDRLMGSGDAQVEYRITDENGKFVGSGVRLYTSATRNIFKDSDAEKTSLPELESSQAKPPKDPAVSKLPGTP